MARWDSIGDGVDPNDIIAGQANAGTETAEEVTILSGEAAVDSVRGAVIGQVKFALDTTTYAGTGNGAMSGEVMGEDAQIGDYLVTCIAADTDSGTFSVVAPDGTRLADAVVAAAFVSTHINFTIADGGTDFVVGDLFTVIVIAGSLKYILSLAAATDGSQTPAMILADAVDASGADKVTSAFYTGWFKQGRLTYGTGHTAATVKASFIAQGRDSIHLVEESAY